ncbi:hypothetical protein BIW11_09733 [Tropilaelaps mercedesae]|uniref:Telomere-associated protein Rif1 N-terminal domain-containing protein n=1 Tax=Tropilaelaps mercedesae TaxID=418985 RepID=A0A1V9XIS0_9ACAR|nr:hypothetical protein BIW11_09733 [Tropilaelaps mercedesae]
MEFTEPSSQAEAAESLTKFREQWTTLDPTQIGPVFEWLEQLDSKWENLHCEIIYAMGDLAEGTMELGLCRRVIEHLKKNSHRCKGDAAKAYVSIAILLHLLKDEPTAVLADSVLSAIRTLVYKDEVALAGVIGMFKAKLVPKMKEMADAKQFQEALTLWRAIIRFTGFEKVPTVVTNGVLHIVTLAFKETDPNVHVDAFSSWRVLVESLPRPMLRKAAYVKLLLNPLNRVYRDTDAVTTPHKFAAWWQLVRSLEDDIEAHFDDVVFPLINKVFSIPSAKARQVNPTAFASPTRDIPHEAYAILALLLYKGSVEIMTEMTKLDSNLPMNQHAIKDACFAKHQSLLAEVLTLVLNNIVHRVTPPPHGYPYILAKLLLSRIISLYEGGHHGLVRVFLSTIYKLLQAKLFDTDQMLSVYTDLANGVPQKVMGSSQFNLRDGSSSMHECPIVSLTAFFVQHVPVMCQKERADTPAMKITKNKRTYRHLLKVLLECGSTAMNFLHFTDHVSKSLGQGEGVLQTDSWLEIADHLSSFIKHTHEVNQGGSLEHDFSALINTLKYPLRPNLNLTTDVIKKWTELFTVFAIDAALVKDVAVNQPIEELCAHILDDLSKTDFDLNRLMLCSQAFETVAKQACLETVTVGKKIPLGNLYSLVKCIALLANRGREFVQSKKQLKSNCQFFVTIVHICHALVQRTNDLSLCRHVLFAIVPELIPLLEYTKNKAVVRETSLALVELPLLHALALFAETFVDKAEKAVKIYDEKFMEIARAAIEHGSGHWKSNIRDSFIRYAKFLSIPVVEPEPVLQSLSQDVVIPDVSPVTVQPKMALSAKTAAVTLPTAGATVKRRSSRKVTKDDEEFTPIKTAKKKSIFTEHQLEKQSESRIIPSMYQDLSQSIDKHSTQQNGHNGVVIIETRVVAPVIDEDAVFNDITPKKVENEAPVNGDNTKCSSQARRSLVGKDIEDDGVKPIDNSIVEGVKDLHSALLDQPINVAEQETRSITVGEMGDDNNNNNNNNNNENEEPITKKKKRFSYNETDEMPELAVAIDQQPASLTKMIEKIQGEQLEREKEELMQNNSPLRPQGARKRKITGQPIESPITAKLQQRNFLINSPSSRSRMILEAAQARHTINSNSTIPSVTHDGRHSLAGFTPRREKTVGFAPDKATDVSSPQPMTNGLFTAPTSPSVGRSILKRVSTGASAKKVSFSRANEVCAYDKHPRVSTAKSLFPPVMVQSDQNSSAEGTDDPLKEAGDMQGDDLNQTITEDTHSTANETPASEPMPIEPVHQNPANWRLDEPTVAHTNIEFVGGSETTTMYSSGEADLPVTSAPNANVAAISDSVEEIERNDPVETLEKSVVNFISIVQSIRSAQSEQLVPVLDLIASPGFIKSLSPKIRAAFFSKCLATMSSYQCYH